MLVAETADLGKSGSSAHTFERRSAAGKVFLCQKNIIIINDFCFLGALFGKTGGFFEKHFSKSSKIKNSNFFF